MVTAWSSTEEACDLLIADAKELGAELAAEAPAEAAARL